MNIKLRIMILSGCLLIIWVIVRMIRKEKLELKYSLSWIFLSLIVFLLALFPKMIDFIAEMIGIDSPMNMMFFCAILYQFIILFSLTVIQSKNSNRIKELIQKISLLEYDMKQKKKEQ